VALRGLRKPSSVRTFGLCGEHTPRFRFLGSTRVADRDSDAPGPSQINRRSHSDAASEHRSRLPATEFQFRSHDRNGRDGLVVLEVLNRPFVPFSGSTRVECTEISSLAGSRIGLPRVQTEPSRGEFANHACFPSPIAPALGRKLQPTRQMPSKWPLPVAIRQFRRDAECAGKGVWTALTATQVVVSVRGRFRRLLNYCCVKK
jgi:hypothetical protein